MQKVKFEEYPLVIPDIEKIKKEFYDGLDKFKNAPDAFTAIGMMIAMDMFFDDIQTDFSIIYVRNSIDTRNEEYSKAKEISDEMSPLIQSLGHEYSLALLNCKFRPEIEKLTGKLLFDKIELGIKTFDDSIIGDLQEENKLTSEYDELIASAEIEFEGKTYNLSQITKFAESSDRDVRRRSCEKVEQWMKERDSKFSEIYSKLVSLRNNMAKKLGYNSFIDLAYDRMGRTDWNAKDVESYRNQIRDVVVDVAAKLTKNKSERCGIESPQFYDLTMQFADGNPTPKGDKDYLVNAAQEMYNEMGEEIGNFFKYLVDCNLLELEAKAGKMGGGYMAYFPRYKAPFVFANFNGTSGDVDVLTHEIGHAFQGYMSRDILPSVYRDPTMEEAEIHSMSMEFLAAPWMDKFFKEDKDKYLLSHLEEAIIFLPYGATVDEFQHWIYSNPEATHEQRCNKWRELEMKYTPWKKYDEFEYYNLGTRWIRQSHIFTMPFYYIDYTLAQVVALQFLGLSNTNHKDAWEKYVKICSLGGKFPFTKLLTESNLDNPFTPGTIAKTFEPVKAILEKYKMNLEQPVIK